MSVPVAMSHRPRSPSGWATKPVWTTSGQTSLLPSLLPTQTFSMPQALLYYSTFSHSPAGMKRCTYALLFIVPSASRLSLGTELLYQKAGPNQTALLSLGGQYRGSDWEASARVGLHSWQLTYHQRLKDLVLMAECEGSLMQVSQR